uniref:Uncharacterized protein n=1 Tax=viral metagenome TaxID=1070528 RepID=A0A6M3J4P2_9ZZZZ
MKWLTDCPWCGSNDTSCNDVANDSYNEDTVLKDCNCDDCGCAFTIVEKTTVTTEIDEEGDVDKKDYYK